MIRSHEMTSTTVAWSKARATTISSQDCAACCAFGAIDEQRRGDVPPRMGRAAPSGDARRFVAPFHDDREQLDRQLACAAFVVENSPSTGACARTQAVTPPRFVWWHALR
jgi:hypothetical protein